MALKNFDDFLNSKKFNKYVNLFCLASMVVGVVIFTILFTQVRKYEQKRIEYDNLLSEYEERLGESVEIAQVISEINTLYENNAIKNNPDFSLANDYALANYVIGLNDKYARYFRPEDFVDNNNKDNDYKVGIGISFTYDKDADIGLKINHVFEGSTAHSSGLRVGDYITHVNGICIADVDLAKFVNYLSGEEGDTVDVTVSRDGKSTDYTLTLTKYDMDSVLSKDINGTAYVRIVKFTNSTSEKFKDTMNKFNKQGFEKYVVDLRGNPGGHLESVVDMLDFLVGEGKIVSTVDCNGEENYRYISDKKEFNGDIVVLVNGNTASASELFAQTMKDFNKATVIGTQTYGKGTVCGVFPLTNGGAIMLSTGTYETNSGTQLEGVGVTPDIKVDAPEDFKFHQYEIDETNDSQLKYALDYLNK